jgi:hypothetical protein
MNALNSVGMMAVAIGTGCMFAGWVPAMASGGTKQCSASYTDCANVTRTVEWECSSNQDCCTTTYMDEGPDGQRGTSDDCISGLSGDCDTAPCDTITYGSSN